MRLDARSITVNRRGETEITTSVGTGDLYVLVTLDGKLRPKHVTVSDALRAATLEWPPAERERFLNGYGGRVVSGVPGRVSKSLVSPTHLLISRGSTVIVVLAAASPDNVPAIVGDL